MQKIRLIPVVLLRNGVVVQSKGFKRYQLLGNPSTIVWRLTNWSSDELIYLDISRDKNYDLRRDDLNYPNRSNIFDILSDISKRCFMPLTFGGGIRTLEDIDWRINNGADKVSINTSAYRTPNLITEGAKKYGSQCIVVSIDVRKSDDGHYKVFIQGGREETEYQPAEWAKKAEELGAGEILLNSIDRDGFGQGYDPDLVREVISTVSIPVIILGGVGDWEHFVTGIRLGASAVAAANIFHYTEHSVHKAKSHLYNKGCNVRKPLVETLLTERGI